MEHKIEHRWIQRFSNYKKALSQLEKFIVSGQGHFHIHGSRDATREAFKLELIQEGDMWMSMINDRNRTSHAYNQATAKDIADNITKRFFPLFVALRETLRELEHVR